ncbi:MAG: hypothetical protein WEH44_07500, partial [Pirellulaceae bacterium]
MNCRTLALLLVVVATPLAASRAAELRVGAAKVDITNREAGPVNDPLYAKALVISDGSTTAVIVTVDAVAIAEIGSIKNEYLANVRAALLKDLGIAPHSVLINASHCHGIVCGDVEQRTVQAVKEAWQKMVPVKVGAGTGREDRVSENRRLKLKDGTEADVRHAYSLPADQEVVGVGPIDPEIGILRLDRLDGQTLAVVYNFACHPIQGVPSGGNTADITGFASQAIEENLGDGAIALFVQGCGGDINPAGYKDPDHPRDAEPLGNLLGLSTLRALHAIKTRQEDRFKLIHETLELPRADIAPRIADLEAERGRLMASLAGTTLNFKTFLPLLVKYRTAGDFPAGDSHRYLNEKALGREHLSQLDAVNRRNLEQYLHNIAVMEQLTRTQTNLALLKKHHAGNLAAGKRTLDVELVGLRVGDFVLTTFPGELTVRIGLAIKRASPHENTFVAGYTNGYIYYAPTSEQLLNVG